MSAEHRDHVGDAFGGGRRPHGGEAVADHRLDRRLVLRPVQVALRLEHRRHPAPELGRVLVGHLGRLLLLELQQSGLVPRHDPHQPLVLHHQRAHVLARRVCLGAPALPPPSQRRRGAHLLKLDAGVTGVGCAVALAVAAAASRHPRTRRLVRSRQFHLARGGRSVLADSGVGVGGGGARRAGGGVRPRHTLHEEAGEQERRGGPGRRDHERDSGAVVVQRAQYGRCEGAHQGLHRARSAHPGAH